MSSFHGNSVVADILSSQDVGRSLGNMLQLRDLAEALDTIWDEEVIEQKFAHHDNAWVLNDWRERDAIYAMYSGITYLSVSPLWETLLLACLGLSHTLCAKVTTEENLPISST